MTENHEVDIIESETGYVNCCIGGKEYRVSTFLSTGDCFDIESYLASDEHEYRIEIAKIFRDKIDCGDEEKPSLESVIALDDDCLQKMLLGMLQSDKELLTAYQELADTEDPYYRFMLAINQYITEQCMDIAQSVVDAIKESNIDFNRIGKAAIDAVNGITSFVTSISERIKRFEQTYGDGLQKFIKVLSEAAVAVNPLNFTEEELQQILDAYAKWGSYGWTPPGRIQFNQMYTPPQNQEQADEQMLQYCTEAEMDRLFEYILNHQLAVQCDVEEAVFLYRNQKYKACALVLFALIDGLLISSQKEEDINRRKNRRDSGSAAFNNLRKRFERDHPDSNIPKQFVCQAMAACMATFFERGNDFKNEPVNLNRNYIGHGMSKRTVGKTDCIKVFLLYRHILHFLRTM